MTNPLSEFCSLKYGESAEELLEKLDIINQVEVEIHKIPVKGGYLRIRVEEGVPTITYMSDSTRYLVEMVCQNSLVFHSLDK